MTSENVAGFVIRCLENEGVRFVFGLPGEENVHLVDALSRSKIRFILVRHEQAASFMADIYGRVTGQAGVCLATLGPGAINLLLGTADANTDSSPMVALSAQGGLRRIYKESHQIVDLVSLFKPITKWADLITTPEAVPEMIRSAFKLAQTERPGSVYLGIPDDVEKEPMPAGFTPLKVNVVRDSSPSQYQIDRAVAILRHSKKPIVLAGHGAARNHASESLIHFSERLNIPVATTFMGKGVFPENHPNSLGTVGFRSRDYVNFGFDQADVIVCVGYDLQEFDPAKINPDGNKQIIHLHLYPALVDAHYQIEVGIEANISESLDALCSRVEKFSGLNATDISIRNLLKGELENGARNDTFPLAPARIVSDTRKAMRDEDIVLVDTGALKMWMARLYPTNLPNTCLISNGLSTMGFALPGAISTKLAMPERNVLAATGDGGFLMNSQEIETALREKIPLVVLIWVDGAYGLIKWEMERALGRSSHVNFGNPDFVKLAESYGAKGYAIKKAEELFPTLQRALSDDTVSVLSCPVDYSYNTALNEKLGDPFDLA